MNRSDNSKKIRHTNGHRNHKNDRRTNIHDRSYVLLDATMISTNTITTISTSVKKKKDQKL